MVKVRPYIRNIEVNSLRFSKYVTSNTLFQSVYLLLAIIFLNLAAVLPRKVDC